MMRIKISFCISVLVLTFAINNIAFSQSLNIVFGSPQDPDIVNAFELTLSDPTGNDFGRGGCVSDGYGDGWCENDYTITIWQGGNTYYSGSTEMPFNYNGIIIPNMSQTQFAPPNNSNFNVTVTDSWSGLGPWTCTNCFQTSNGLGIADGNLINLQAFPNPATASLSITANATLQEVVVYTVDGALIKAYTHNLTHIDVSDLTKGVYVLVVRSEEGLYRSTFVKS